MDHGFGSKKRMTFGRTTFDTYKVIAPFNVYLGDDSVVETIRMGSTLIKVMVKDKKKRTCIKDLLPCVQVASKIDHGEQILVKWTKI